MEYIYGLLIAFYLLFNLIVALAVKDPLKGDSGGLFWILMIFFGLPIVVILVVVLIPLEVIREMRGGNGKMR